MYVHETTPTNHTLYFILCNYCGVSSSIIVIICRLFFLLLLVVGQDIISSAIGIRCRTLVLILHKHLLLLAPQYLLRAVQYP